MPSEIVNLDKLVPTDIVFKWQGQEYTLPGDIDTETTFIFSQMLRDLGQAEAETDEARTAVVEAKDARAQKPAMAALAKADLEQKKLTLLVEAEVLKLFQVRHPEIEKLPFGAAGFQVVLMHVLVKLGFGGAEVVPPVDPRNRTTRRAAAKKKTSTRSRSSRSS